MNPKTSPLSRFLGFTLILGAIAGLIFSGWAITSIWRIKEPFTDRLELDLTLLNTSLAATEEGITIAQDTLEQISISLVTVQDGLTSMAGTLADTGPLLNSFSTVLGDDLPATLEATQTSLNSAQTSATLIDDLLETITSIRILGLQRYAPATPLHIALEDVSTSLNSLPDSLADIETGLTTTSRNTSVIAADLLVMVERVEILDENLQQTRLVLDDYQEIVGELQERTTNLQKNVSSWIDQAAVLTSAMLVWLAVTQLGLMSQGIFLMTGLNVPDKNPPTN